MTTYRMLLQSRAHVLTDVNTKRPPKAEYLKKNPHLEVLNTISNPFSTLRFYLSYLLEITQSLDELFSDFFFTAVPCILKLSKSFIYQLMHNRVALKEY
jgi:hypothetical protein